MSDLLITGIYLVFTISKGFSNHMNLLKTCECIEQMTAEQAVPAAMP